MGDDGEASQVLSECSDAMEANWGLNRTISGGTSQQGAPFQRAVESQDQATSFSVWHSEGGPQISVDSQICPQPLASDRESRHLSQM